MRPEIIEGDAREILKTLDDESVQCVVTSPPYWGLRDYGSEGQLGLEETPEEYVANLVSVFQEVKRVLRKDGTVWLNLGDSYAGSNRGGFSSEQKAKEAFEKAKNEKNTIGQRYSGIYKKTGLSENIKAKDLVGIPWRVALALQADGWYLRSDIIWDKPNPMPEPVTDRPTKSHEYIFLLTKSKKYYYDADAIKEPAIHHGKIVKATGGNSKNANSGFTSQYKRGFTTNDNHIGDKRNKRSVWTITKKPYKGAHFATFPEELPETCIKAGTKRGDVVLDIFAGSGTTLRVASRLGRKGIGIELNGEYLKLARKRCRIDSESLLKYV